MLAASAAEPVPVFLDTDIGDDIDDTWALGMLLGMPEVDLKLITTASDNTPEKTRLTTKILKAAGRTDIPIGTGLKTSDRPLNQARWVGDFDLAQYPGQVHADGIQALIDAIHAAPRPVTLLVIGPQTNIQEALRRAPDIAGKARTVAMAGSVEVGYDNHPGRQPEFNIVKNVEAARAVFAAPWDITLAPLDVCGALVLRGERYAKVAASGNPRAATVIGNYCDWNHFKDHPEGQSSILYDTVAAYLVADTAWCKMETRTLSIDDKGNTVPDPAGRPVRCALGWNDRNAFEDRLVAALAGNHASGNP